MYHLGIRLDYRDVKKTFPSLSQVSDHHGSEDNIYDLIQNTALDAWDV
jgi:hypothetical protein